MLTQNDYIDYYQTLDYVNECRMLAYNEVLFDVRLMKCKFYESLIKWFRTPMLLSNRRQTIFFMYVKPFYKIQ